MLTKMFPLKHTLITEKNEWRAELKWFQKLKLSLNAIMIQTSGVNGLLKLLGQWPSFLFCVCTISNTIGLFLPLGLLSLQFISITEKKPKKKKGKKKERKCQSDFNVCKIYDTA